MAEIHGNQGGVFYRSGYIAADTISFPDNNPDQIADSGSGLVTAGFIAGDTIAVTGSTSNNGEYTIAGGGVAAGALTLIGGDSLDGEAAGDDVIVQTVPGTRIGGFFSWTLNWAGDAIDTTDFADGGSRTFTRGSSNWTASAEKFWLDDEVGLLDMEPGESVLLRLFYCLHICTQHNDQLLL